MRFFILPYCILSLLILSMAVNLVHDHAVAGQAPTEMVAGNLVFVEDITATWCVYCPSASEGLKDLSSDRSDFRFVTLVDDRVPDAAVRNEEYNPSGFPTVMFDGGYEEVVGSQSSTAPYDDAIESCKDRTLPSLDLDVRCYDEGASELRIDVDISNNEGQTYSGRLLINVVEIVSRYQDYDGNQYPYSLIGYAADETISVSAGGTHSTSATWIGSRNQDLEGNDFSDIDPDNMVIYALVVSSNSNYKARMTFPPSYFTAYYIDAVGEAFPEELRGAPEVDIISPRSGSRISEEVEIIAEVVSENELDMVQVKIGTEEWVTMDLDYDQFTYLWDSTDSGNGQVKISVRAADDEGLTGIDTIEVVVENEDVTTPPEILELTHSPKVVREGDEVEISVEVLEHDTSLRSVELTYCVGEMCFIPQRMEDEGFDLYSKRIGPFEEGDLVKYTVMLEDSDGTKVTSPDQTFTVQAPFSSGDDDTIERTDSDDGSTSGSVPDNSPSLYLVIIPFAVVFSAILFKRRR